MNDIKKGKTITYQEMCETIAEFLNAHGENVTWKEVWEYSPTGELYMIHEWYPIALHWKNNKEVKHD